MSEDEKLARLEIRKRSMKFAIEYNWNSGGKDNEDVIKLAERINSFLVEELESTKD